jgi:hypothetical protein
MISELGLMGAGFGGDKVRIADDFHSIDYWERQAALSSTPGDPWVDMAVPVDPLTHTHRVYRLSPDVAGLQIDANAVETTTLTVPTSDLPPFLMSFGAGNQFAVDWIRVRKWCGAEAETELRAPHSPTAVIVASYSTRARYDALWPILALLLIGVLLAVIARRPSVVGLPPPDKRQ